MSLRKKGVWGGGNEGSAHNSIYQRKDCYRNWEKREIAEMGGFVTLKKSLTNSASLLLTLFLRCVQGKRPVLVSQCEIFFKVGQIFGAR